MQRVLLQQTKELRQILNAWDPIGVSPFEDGPADEYDCLLYPLLGLLSDDPDPKILSVFLSKQLRGHFGLIPTLQGDDPVVERIVEWWQAQNHKDSGTL